MPFVLLESEGHRGGDEASGEEKNIFLKNREEVKGDKMRFTSRARTVRGAGQSPGEEERRSLGKAWRGRSRGKQEPTGLKDPPGTPRETMAEASTKRAVVLQEAREGERGAGAAGRVGSGGPGAGAMRSGGSARPGSPAPELDVPGAGGLGGTESGRRRGPGREACGEAPAGEGQGVRPSPAGRSP